MAITFPRSDVLQSGIISPDGWQFKLTYRQETSRQARGVTLVKDLGTPLFGMSATTRPLYPAEALSFEAVLESLDGGVHAFYATDLRAPYPIAHLDGAFTDDAVISSIGINNKSLALSGLDSGFTISRGDYLSFAVPGWRSLHQAMETVTADGAGISPSFEVRPHLFPGTEPGLAVRLKHARTSMMIIADTISKQQVDTRRTVISFQAVQCPPA